MLFRLKYATLDRVNAPGWLLFVQGVGNYLMGFRGREPLSRERAMELESFMNDTRSSLRLFRAHGSRRDGPGLRERVPYKTPRVAEAEAACSIARDEKLWPTDKLDADNRIDPLEQALMAFIAEENGGW